MLTKTVLVLTIALVLTLPLVGCGTVARGVVREGAEIGARTTAEREGNESTPAGSYALERARRVSQQNRATAEAATATSAPLATAAPDATATPAHIAAPTPTETAITKTKIAQDEAENLWPSEVKAQISAYRIERGASLGAKFEDCFISRMASSMLDPKPEEWSRLPKVERDTTEEEGLKMWRSLEPDFVAPLREECFLYAFGTLYATREANDQQRLASSIFTALYMLAIGIFGDIRAQHCVESHEEYVHSKLQEMAVTYVDSPAHAGVGYTEYRDPDISGPIKHGLIYTKHLGVHVCP